MSTINRQCSSDVCSFCWNACTGPFRHILTVTEKCEVILKPVLQELIVPVSPLAIEGYQSCDSCRRRIISSHNIPESCFKIMPSVEIQYAKVAPNVNFEQLQSTVSSNDELPHLKTETELILDDDHEPILVYNGLDERLTVEKAAQQLRLAPVLGADCREREKKTSSEASIEKKHPGHECPICHKFYSDKSNLRGHIQRHTGIKPYKCEQCGMRYYQNSKLKAHMRTHTGERPYVCPYCLKTFVRSATLRVHIRTHTRETPHVCKFCNLGFSQSYGLTVHLRRKHNQVTIYRGREVGIPSEYSCEYCGKIYRSSKCYKLHVEMHSTGKLFNCERCGKQYSFLHRCKTTSGSPKEFPCDICGRVFYYQKSVVNHMISKHNQHEYSSINGEGEQSESETIVGD